MLSSCRKRAPPESCTGQILRAGWERICRDRRDARSHFLLCGGCLSGVPRKAPPSRGDPEPDIPYFSRITLIACPKCGPKKRNSRPQPASAATHWPDTRWRHGQDLHLPTGGWGWRAPLRRGRGGAKSAVYAKPAHALCARRRRRRERRAAAARRCGSAVGLAGSGGFLAAQRRALGSGGVSWPP